MFFPPCSILPGVLMSPRLASSTLFHFAFLSVTFKSVPEDHQGRRGALTPAGLSPVSLQMWPSLPTRYHQVPSTPVALILASFQSPLFKVSVAFMETQLVECRTVEVPPVESLGHWFNYKGGLHSRGSDCISPSLSLYSHETSPAVLHSGCIL